MKKLLSASVVVMLVSCSLAMSQQNVRLYLHNLDIPPEEIAITPSPSAAKYARVIVESVNRVALHKPFHHRPVAAYGSTILEHKMQAHSVPAATLTGYTLEISTKNFSDCKRKTVQKAVLDLWDLVNQKIKRGVDDDAYKDVIVQLQYTRGSTVPEKGTIQAFVFYEGSLNCLTTTVRLGSSGDIGRDLVEEKQATD